MSKARTLADFISDGSEFADGTISVAEVSGAAPLASPTFTGTVNISSSENNVALFDSSHATSTQMFLRNTNTGTGLYTVLGFAPANSVSGATITTYAEEDFSEAANRTARLEIDTRDNGNWFNRLTLGRLEAVFNDGSDATDFRVESDGNANMLFVDAGLDKVSIGSSSNFYSKLAVHGSKTLSTGIPNDQLSVIDESSMAAGVGGSITLWGKYTTGGADAEGAAIEAVKDNATTGNYGFGMKLRTRTHGSTMDERLSLSNSATVFNENGFGTDFRVESDSNANMLFVDAGASTATFGSNTAYGVLGIQQGASAGIPATTLGLNHIHANNKYIDFKWYDGSLMNIAQEGGSNIGINWSNTLAFNSSESSSSDFRIASDTISHLFAIDASENRVSIGGTNFGEGSGYIFNVRGGTSRFANPAADATVRIEGGSYTDPHLARLTLTGGYGDTGRTRFWHIDGQAHGGGGNVYNDLRFGYEVSNSATLYEVMRFNNEGHVIVNENGASNVDFRVETDSINDAFVIDADQDVIKFKTNVWQHAPLTGNFAGGWVTVTNLDTLSNLVSNSAAKIRVYANENGRTNVSYSEHIAVRTNGTWVLQQLGEVTAGNSHGNANLQMSGTNLQIQNAANSSIGAWKVSLELFR